MPKKKWYAHCVCRWFLYLSSGKKKAVITQILGNYTNLIIEVILPASIVIRSEKEYHLIVARGSHILKTTEISNQSMASIFVLTRMQ